MNAVNTKYTCCSTRFYHHTAVLLSLARNEISDVQCEATVEMGEPSRLQKSTKSVTSACRPPTPAQGRHGTTAGTRRWKDPRPPALPACLPPQLASWEATKAPRCIFCNRLTACDLSFRIWALPQLFKPIFI